MPDRLLLRLAPDGGLAWLLQRDGSPRVAVATPGDPPAEVLAAAGEIVVLVPGEDVLLASARIGARSRAQLLQALPYAIEDQLLAPVEELHFAAERSPGAEAGVAVVARARLAGWLEVLAARGIAPDALLPESLAVPVGEVLVEEARATLRLGAWTAFTCEPADLPAWLEHCATRPPALRVQDARRSVVPLSLPVPHENQRVGDGLACLGSALAALPLNLLEGDFAPRRRRRDPRRGWRVAAVLAAAVVVLALLDLGGSVLRLAHESARLEAAAADAVRAAFPDVDAAQLARLGAEPRLRARLERLQGGAESRGLVQVLGTVAPVLGSVSPTRVQTRGMEYRNGSLEVALCTPDVAELDRIRESLATLPGITVAVVQASSGTDGVDGRLRIGGAGR
jgi:general secretion pathway protein L